MFVRARALSSLRRATSAGACVLSFAFFAAGCAGHSAKTLEARQALEAFAEDANDVRAMQSCVGLLHQVLGTLRIVELYGAAELDQEMEHLAQAVLDGKVTDRD